MYQAITVSEETIRKLHELNSKGEGSEVDNLIKNNPRLCEQVEPLNNARNHYLKVVDNCMSEYKKSFNAKVNLLTAISILIRLAELEEEGDTVYGKEGAARREKERLATIQKLLAERGIIQEHLAELEVRLKNSTGMEMTDICKQLIEKQADYDTSTNVLRQYGFFETNPAPQPTPEPTTGLNKAGKPKQPEIKKEDANA